MGNLSFAKLYIPDLIGVLIIITTMSTNLWRFKNRNYESKILLYMLMTSLASCVAEMIAFALDGHPGTGHRILVYLSNVILYVAYLLMSVLWIRLLANHLGVVIKRIHNIILYGLVILGLLLLLTNCFWPMVFSIDSMNVYHREPVYWMFVVINSLIFLDGIMIYLFAKKRGVALKFFPVWIYIAPIPFAIIIQSVFYGVSIVWVCIAVALAGIMCGVHNEMLFRDKVTGLYNRIYLNDLQDNISSKTEADIKYIKLSLTSYRMINDTFGAYEGDNALYITGAILTSSIGKAGTVIYYGGNDFILALNSSDDQFIDEIINEVQEAFKEYNNTSDKHYKLNIAIGNDFASDKSDSNISNNSRSVKFNSEEETDGILKGEVKVKGIKVKRLSIVLIALEAVFVTISIMCAITASNKYNTVEVISSEYLRMQENIYNLREATDYLTTKSRQYVLTGKMEYAIQYYDEMYANKRSEKAIKDVYETVANINLSGIGSLDEALARSKNLALKEFDAMALIYSISDNKNGAPEELANYQLSQSELKLTSEGRKMKAMNLLFGADYSEKKENINNTIDYASNGLLYSIRASLNQCSKEYHTASIALKFLLCVCALIYAVIVFALFRLILNPLNKGIAAISMDQPMEYAECYELNYLTHSFNRLYEKNLMTRLYLKDTAERDALTGLLNRNGYEEVKSYYRESDESIAFIIIDADYFKLVNDNYGHDGGDRALKRIANVLNENFRENDFIVRYGGDEFIVIMTGLESSNRVIIEQKLSRINDRLGKAPDEKSPKLSVSIGVAFSEHGYSDELFEAADGALYKAKENGRGNHCFAM